MSENHKPHRSLLKEIARREMLKRGFLPDFSDAALSELKKIQSPAAAPAGYVRDLRGRLWCSIDNDDSLDLDQLTTAEVLPGGKTKVMVAIADVDALIKRGSEIDAHALHNTTSIYTAAIIFSMLPEKLSTNLTSLNPGEDRLANVVEMVLHTDGSLMKEELYPAMVRSHAKLAYDSVAAWLEGTAPAPDALTDIPALAKNLLIQDSVAQGMQLLRQSSGALSLETIEARPVFDGDDVARLESEEKNRAKAIIENFMIAANGAAARYLSNKGLPSIRRVVRAPDRWDRIVELARERSTALPSKPDPAALEEFLNRQKAEDPMRFPDLSLALIKLMGPGEYVAEISPSAPPGHFGLAVRDYAHSTAPNRRYPDLVTQRLLKSAFRGEPSPYTIDELQDLASHFTRKENDANKVERQVGKSIAALLLEHRLGETFEAIVTGAAAKGTWVRLLALPVEGKLVKGFKGVDIGRRLRVKLVSVNVDQGFIDFSRAK